MPYIFYKMLRRNFLKKILIFTVGLIAMSNKLFAKDIFNKPLFKDGIFIIILLVTMVRLKIYGNGEKNQPNQNQCPFH